MGNLGDHEKIKDEHDQLEAKKKKFCRDQVSFSSMLGCHQKSHYSIMVTSDGPS